MELEDPNDVIAKTVMKYLGIHEDREFTHLSKTEKDKIGKCWSPF